MLKTESLKTSRSRPEIFGLLFTAALIVIWVLLAPREKTLGDGIRTVYLHVSASWAGLVGMYASGITGLVMLIRGGSKLERLLRSLGWTALGFFGLGLSLSLAAAVVNWGGILWTEPRINASIRILVAGITVQIVGYLWESPRLKGLLWVLVAGYASWALAIAQNVFHPGGAIQETTPVLMQATFFGVFVLMLVAEGLILRIFHIFTKPT